jgi:hypothetical protein
MLSLPAPMHRDVYGVIDRGTKLKPARGPIPRTPSARRRNNNVYPSVVVVNPGRGNLTLGNPTMPRARSRLATPKGLEREPTPPGSASRHSLPPGSASRHSLPSPPPLPPHSWDLGRHHRFKLCVILQTPAMDVAKADLANALVVMVVGEGGGRAEAARLVGGSLPASSAVLPCS